MNRNRFPAAALLLASLTLASCASWFGGDDAAKDKKDKAEEAAVKKPPKVTPICPQVAILRELDTFRDYGREQPAPDQLVGAARLTRITGDCEYVTGKDKRAGIDIAYELDFAAVRGPRLGGRHLALPYFIAVLDPDDKILGKDLLTASIDFASDSDAANHAEDLHVFIPLPEAQQLSGPYYRVLAGFQLSEEQLKEKANPAAAK